MKINNIEKYNTSFCSKISMTPKSISYLQREDLFVRKIFNKNLAKIKNNGQNDTVFIDYSDVCDKAPFRYYVQVIKNINGKLHKSQISGIYEENKYNIEEAYNQACSTLAPVKKDMFNKYMVK